MEAKFIKNCPIGLTLACGCFREASVTENTITGTVTLTMFIICKNIFLSDGGSAHPPQTPDVSLIYKHLKSEILYFKLLPKIT